jgi:hypothetical protein
MNLYYDLILFFHCESFSDSFYTEIDKKLIKLFEKAKEDLNIGFSNSDIDEITRDLS